MGAGLSWAGKPSPCCSLVLAYGSAQTSPTALSSSCLSLMRVTLVGSVATSVVTPVMMPRPALPWRRRARLVGMTVGPPAQSVVVRGRLCQPGGSAGSCRTPTKPLPAATVKSTQIHMYPTVSVICVLLGTVITSSACPCRHMTQSARVQASLSGTDRILPFVMSHS